MDWSLFPEDLRNLLNHPDESICNCAVPAEPGIHRAAVLLPLIPDNGSWQILYIRRSTLLKSHTGQVAFPGGKVEPLDTNLIQTALRETHEEVGILPQSVEVLGSLPPVVTPSGFNITPVVGIVRPPVKLNLQAEEVDRAFTIPLDWLADPQHHQSRSVMINNRMHDGVIYFDLYDGELIWGITGRITVNFLDLLQRSSTNPQ